MITVGTFRWAVTSLRRLSGPARARVARPFSRRVCYRAFPVTSIFVLAEGGRTDLAVRLAGRRLRTRPRRRLIAFAAVVGTPRVCAAVLTGQQVTGPLRRVLGGMAALHHAAVAFDTGHISAAIEILSPYEDVSDRIAGRLEQYRSDLRHRPIPAAGRRTVVPERDRVLHCVSNALPITQSGYTVRTQRIATAQRGAGLEPHVVTAWGWPVSEGVPAPELRLELEGVPYYRLVPDDGRVPPDPYEQRVRGAAALSELVGRVRPAVLHAATGYANGLVAQAAARRAGLPFVYEVRGFLEESWLSRAGAASIGSERHRLLVERETEVMRSADVVVTLAETMRAEIVARGVPAERIRLAPNAVDAALLATGRDGARVRRRHGIGPAEIVIGSVSSLVGYEGFAALLDAAAALRASGISIRVLLAGEGPERRALLARAAELGLGGSVILPGRVSPAAALDVHAAMDIFVLPRTRARVCRLVTPLKPVEAMALGRPVVASDLPAVRELLGDGAAGLLVPPEDPAALADALGALATDPRRRARLGAAGRELVAATRTWSRVAAVYAGIYRDLCRP